MRPLMLTNKQVNNKFIAPDWLSSDNFFTMAAEDTCNLILSEIRRSKLNFQIQETPYSAYICLRKKFRNNFQKNTPSNHHVPTCASPPKNSQSQASEDLVKVVAENVALKQQTEILEETFKKAKN